MSDDTPLLDGKKKKSPKTKKKHTEAGLIGKLRKKFAPPAYAFLSHVGDATGGRHTRTIDAVVMSLWPSRGLWLHGLEIKVSRGDWLREMKNPGKAEPIVRRMDHFSIVAPDGVVHPGELPKTWGHLMPYGAGLREVVKAPKLDAAPLDRPFLAAIMRRVFEQQPSKAAIEGARAEGRANGIEQAEGMSKYKLERIADERDKAVAAMKAFFDECGVPFRQWSQVNQAKELGRIAKVLGSHGHAAMLEMSQTYGRLAKQSRKDADRFERLAKELWAGDDEPELFGASKS